MAICRERNRTTFRALARRGPGMVDWIEREKREYGPGDAILKPLALSICPDDIARVFHDDNMEAGRAKVLGHEAVAEVIEVGRDVQDFTEGDIVVVPAVTPDWPGLQIQRWLYRQGEGRVDGFRFKEGHSGVFSEAFHVNGADLNLAHLPDDISLEAAVMVSDCVSTGLHGAELAKIRPGMTVAVFGLDAAGLMAIAGARLRGAGQIIAVGDKPLAQPVADKLGMTDRVLPSENTADRIAEITDAKGCDVSIVTGGLSLMSSAVESTAPAGIVVDLNYGRQGKEIELTGLPGRNQGKLRQVRRGFYTGGRIRMERLLELIKYDRLDPTGLITHRFYGWQGLKEAFDLMIEKPESVIKPVIMMD